MPRAPRTAAAALLVPVAGLALALPACTGEAEPRPETADSAGADPAPTDAPPANPLGSDARASAATGAAQTAEPATAGGTRLVVSGVALVVPENWTRQQPESTMRAAQYAAPNPAGADAEFVVFRGIGGGADANIERWINQFASLDAGPERDQTSAPGGLTVHTVEMTGAYTVGPMMGGTGEPEPGTGFRGVVITGSTDGDVFLRLTGPAQAVDALDPAWDALLASVESAG